MLPLRMTQLRKPSPIRGRLLLALALIALGMNALVPAGYMVASSSSHVFAITLCPETNPLARAVMAAEGHAQLEDAASHHAAMGHQAPASDDDIPTASRAEVDCAFSALACAGNVPEQPSSDTITLERGQILLAQFEAFSVTTNRRLRPPLRGPPAHG
ncbi:hypothetical protein JN10_2165 [Altererythrobacter ishigakiensis]|uniref:DUF2946 family protein n=2 Tax=Altererythrobacter ishigakiensis TaxID=476157 RepID=A0A562ULZ4_9SPHN|nr:hypothetical protein JN10_2165 [Altererythrobacter ishigakiensis]